MKNKSLIAFIILFIAASIATSQDKIDWMYYWEAKWRTDEDRRYKRALKKTIIFLYDENNSWCRRMRQQVLNNEEIANYINSNYYPVFWHVENYTEEVIFETNHTFDYENNQHSFVKVLTNGRMSFPYIAILDEEFEIICRIPGFRKKSDILENIKFYNQKFISNK